MKSSLAILLFFLLGCVGGLYYTADFDLHLLSVDVLYVLMLLLGINLGCNQDLKGFVRQFSFKMLLVPLATVAGTFLFSAVAGFILSQWSVFDCMAVGSGFAYYSISSVLITQLKAPSIGIGAGYHCPAGQYLPRNDGFGGSTLHQEILRSSGSHFGSRNRFGRYPAGVHQSLFRQGCHSTGHLAWDTDQHQRAFLRVAVL